MNIEHVQRGLLEYFSDWSEADLKEKLFLQSPELFHAVSKAKGIGVPWQYRQALKNGAVNERMFFFECNLGKQYAGNPKYIYEYLLSRYPNFIYVWCYSGSEVIPGDPIIVSRGSDSYYGLLAQSRYIINNTTFPLWYHRPETFYFQTWHGTPFKRLHWDITTRSASKRSTPDFFAKSQSWNALLSPNSYSTTAFRSAFRYEGDIVEFGYPANDIFYDRPRYEAKRKFVRDRLGLCDSDTVYLYAPTWRDGKHLGGAMFEFNLMLDPEKFVSSCPKGSKLLIRSHHMSQSEGALNTLPAGVIDVSMWDDVIELICASDVLITDYSSVVFDWYCTRKPVIYYVPDLEEYVGSLRGAYFDLKEVNAGPICLNQQELIDALRSDELLKFNGSFYARFCGLHDGYAAEKVADFLLSRRL